MNSLHNFLRPLLALTAGGIALTGSLLASDGLWLTLLGIIFLCLLYFILSLVPQRAVRLGGTGIGTPDEREAARQAAFSRSVQLLAGFLLAGFLTLGAHLFRQQVAQADAIIHSQVINETVQVSDGVFERETRLVRPNGSITFTRTIADPGLKPGSDSLQNPRLLSRDLRVQRGRILDAAGGEIAGRTVYSDSYTQRTYPNPDTGYLAGYYNPTIYGLSGLEARYDSYLSGETGTNPLVDQENSILHRPIVGSDVQLTLRPDVQRAAAQALGQRKGAVVVIDIPSGAVLGLVTYPHFDPNGLAFNPNADWDTESRRIISYWGSVADETKRPDLPLLNRATQGLYPPGSTFKTITTAAALDLGKATPQTVFTDTGSIQVEAGGYRHVDCATCRPAGHADPRFTLMEGYQWSLNVVFAELAVYAIKPDPLVQYARKFGFGTDYNADNPAMGINVETSRLGRPEFLATPNGIAATSYGQGEVQSTPLEMALVAATVAHNGELPRPYLVQRVINPTGGVVQETQPKTLGSAILPATAATLTQMMFTSVELGWAKGAAIPGYAVGGKTGTAETGRNNTSHAWFIGIAGKDKTHPQYAVAAMVEEGGEGSRVAVPIGRAALLAALTQK